MIPSLVKRNGSLIGGVDFRRRFLSLLSFKFREFGSVTALSILEAANNGVKKLGAERTRGKNSSLIVYTIHTQGILQSSQIRSCPSSCLPST